jgi:hypothetical protein
MEMTPHQRQKQQPRGVGDTGSSGGGESSGTTKTAMMPLPQFLANGYLRHP